MARAGSTQSGNQVNSQRYKNTARQNKETRAGTRKLENIQANIQSPAKSESVSATFKVLLMWDSCELMMRSDQRQVMAIDDVSRQRIMENGVRGEW